MLTRTCTLLAATILLGTASAALAMSPTGNNYKPVAKAYASPHRVQQPAYDQYRAHDGNGGYNPVLNRPYWDNGYFRNF